MSNVQHRTRISELEAELGRLASKIHYPECWDTAVYPNLSDALHELGCNPDCCIQGADDGTPRPSKAPASVEDIPTSTNSCAETATVITELVSACEQLEKAVLNLLPGAAQIVADVGLINDALCAGVNARGKAKKKGACHE